MAENERNAREFLHGDRLELLLFDLGGRQRFGINVLKVQEIIPTPRLTQVPHAHPAVCGVAHLRGHPLSVIDLSQAVGGPPLKLGEDEKGSIVITEFNRVMQGFLVHAVDRIAVCEWRNVLPPPPGTGKSSYITGVTRIDEEIIEVLDVEKVLGEVVAMEDTGAFELGEDAGQASGKRIMVVDDSSVARRQTAQTLEQIGAECVLARDGKEALEALQAAGDEGRIDMIISDIEMPEMDGYSLTREIRKDPNLHDLYILLHTSLNGAINPERAEQAGANDILTKFVPEELARMVLEALGSETAGR